MPRLSENNDPLDLLLFALAHQTRRQLLAELREGEQTILSLAEHFDVSLPAISTHIKLLEKAGLVVRHVRGREHWIASNPTGLDPAALWIEQQQKFWSGKLDRLAELIAQDTTTQ